MIQARLKSRVGPSRLVVAGGLVLLLLVAWCNPAVAQRTVSLVGDPWPPYVNGNLGEYAETGIAVEIINRVFAQIEGVQASFPLIPWKRALLEVERGQSDGIAMLLKTAERERYMRYSAPLITGYNLLWYLEKAPGEAFVWNRIEDLHGLRIGAVEGYSYGDEIDAAIAAGEIVAVLGPTVEHLFAMLVAGRVDLVMANDAVGYELARQSRDIKIRPAERPTNAETFYMGISKLSPAVDLLPQIDLAITRLQRDGVIERIVRGEPAD